VISAPGWHFVLGLLLFVATGAEPHVAQPAVHVAPIVAVNAAADTTTGAATGEERIDLAAATFTRNGLPSDGPTRGAPGTPEAGSVSLPFGERGVRWAMQWSSTEAITARLALEWIPGPDGALFEVVLDGQRLSPARDSWRPSAREVTSDLGPVWLGAGGHLLEFVAREQSPDAALHLCALVIERL